MMSPCLPGQLAVNQMMDKFLAIMHINYNTLARVGRTSSGNVCEARRRFAREAGEDGKPVAGQPDFGGPVTDAAKTAAVTERVAAAQLSIALKSLPTGYGHSAFRPSSTCWSRFLSVTRSACLDTLIRSS
jgi:hypothetical protein